MRSDGISCAPWMDSRICSIRDGRTYHMRWGQERTVGFEESGNPQVTICSMCEAGQMEVAGGGMLPGRMECRAGRAPCADAVKFIYQ